MEDETIIEIARLVSTIARLDRIRVLDPGRNEEDGNHCKLPERNGLYARFWNSHSGGFIDTETQEARE